MNRIEDFGSGTVVKWRTTPRYNEVVISCDGEESGSIPITGEAECLPHRDLIDAVVYLWHIVEPSPCGCEITGRGSTDPHTLVLCRMHGGRVNAN